MKRIFIIITHIIKTSNTTINYLDKEPHFIVYRRNPRVYYTLIDLRGGQGALLLLLNTPMYRYLSDL